MKEFFPWENVANQICVYNCGYSAKIFTVKLQLHLSVCMFLFAQTQ